MTMAPIKDIQSQATNIPKLLKTNTDVTHQPDVTSPKLAYIQTEAPTMHQPFCKFMSDRNKNIIHPDTPSDMSDWSFQRKRNCPQFTVNVKKSNQTRLKYSLQCSNGHASLVPSLTNRSDDVDIVSMASPCLSKFIATCCTRDNEVPNVVHYVHYFNKTMRFDFFANFLSVIRFVRPCLILLHGEYLPYGKYWDFIVGIFPNILHAKRPRPLYIQGKKVQFHEHSGDVMRLKALKAFGGIFLDMDYFVLKELQPFRKYETTLCDQQTGYMLNCFIMAKKNATFVSLWLDGYKDFRNDSYSHNSMFYNAELAHKYPHLLHVENGTLCCWKEFVGVDRNTTKVYPWPDIYGFHLYSRTINFLFNEWYIRSMNSTLGSLARHVVYGNKELCE